MHHLSSPEIGWTIGWNIPRSIIDYLLGLSSEMVLELL